MLYYTTINNKLDGRASYGYKNKEDAIKKLDEQNSKAKSMNLKIKYFLCECQNNDIREAEMRG